MVLALPDAPDAVAWRSDLLARLVLPYLATDGARAMIAAGDVQGGLEALRALLEEGDVEQRRATRPRATSLVKALGNDAEFAATLRRLRNVL